MTIQPINIVVKDSIDGGVGQKLLEIARNARQAETELTDMRSALTLLSAEQLKAATSAEKLKREQHSTATAAARAATEVARLTKEQHNTAAAASRAATAKVRLENVTKSATTSEERLGILLRQSASAKLAVQRAEEALATERLRLHRMTEKGTQSETMLALQHERLEAATEKLAGETIRLEVTNEKLAAEQSRVGAIMQRTTGYMTGQAAAISTLDTGMNQHNQRLAANRRHTSLAAHHAQNLAFQFQDIGVSLASGQPAWRVFMQQGAQIQGIMSQAQLSVKGLGQEALRMGGSLVKAVLPWTPILAGVGLAFGGIYLALDGVTDSLNDFLGLNARLTGDLKGAEGALGEIDNRMITMGDTIGGLGRWFSDLWSVHVMPTVGSIWDGLAGLGTHILNFFRWTANGVIGLVMGASNAMSVIFRALPNTLGDLMFRAANAAIEGVEAMINGTIGLLNSFLQGTNEFFEPMRDAMRKLGVDLAAFGTIGEVSLVRVTNAYEGAAAATVEMAQEQYNAAQGIDYVGNVAAFTAQTYESFIETLADYAVANRDARLSEEERVRVMRRAETLYEQIRAPIVDYTETMAALSVMLNTVDEATGRALITQREYNAAVAGLQINQGMATLDVELALAGGDQFAEQRARVEEQLQERLLLLEQYQRVTEMSNEEHQARLNQIEDDAARQRLEIQQEEQRMRLAGASAAAGDLSTILGAAIGEQSEAARAMFAISKAFAIAESTLSMHVAIMKAMALGWPQNMPFIAAAASQGAQIISTLKATQPAYADGGYVSGPGGPRDDQIQARLSNGEFVINAAATAEHRGILEAINNGASRSQIARQPAFARGGSVTNNSRIDRSFSSVRSSGTNISFGDVSISGSDMSKEDVREVMGEVVDQKMRNVYGPKILTASRQQANDDMTQRFQRKKI